jgi:hypothetical protein
MNFEVEMSEGSHLKAIYHFNLDGPLDEINWNLLAARSSQK